MLKTSLRTHVAALGGSASPPMPLHAWELYLLKTGQHPTLRLAEKRGAPTR